MNESQVTSMSPQTEHRPENKAELDWFLQSVVDMANYGTAEIGVTLCVGGLIISGKLVGGDKYFAGVAEEWKEGMAKGGSKDADEWREIISRYGDIYRKPRDKMLAAYKEGREPEPVSDANQPHFVHLKGARIFFPGERPIPSNTGVWWRGRLEAVDGFSLGELSFSAS